MKQKSFKNSNNLTQDDQTTQVIPQRDSSFSKVQRGENKSFNRRGRICVPYKKEDSVDNKTITEGILQNQRSNSQPNNQMKQTFQTLKDSQEFILNDEGDNIYAGDFEQQHQAQSDEQNQVTKPAFQGKFDTQGTSPLANIRSQSYQHNASSFDQDRNSQNKKLNQQNGNQLQENLRYGMNAGQLSQMKSPKGVIGFFQQKPLGTQVRSYTTVISTSNTIVPQPTPQISSLNLKSKKLRPQKVVGKKQQNNKYTKQTTEDKQSDEDIDDFNEGTNKDIIQSLTQNQIHQLLTTHIDNNQSEQIDINNNQITQNSQKLSSKYHSTLHKQKSVSPHNNQNFTGSLSAFDQQKTLQTENDDIEIAFQNQSQLFALDSCKYDSQNGMVNSGLSQNYSNFNSNHITKQNGSKELLEGLQEVLEDELSTQNQVEQDCQKLQQQIKSYLPVNTLENINLPIISNPIITKNNNFIEDKISSSKQSPKKILNEHNIIDQKKIQKSFENSGEKDFVFIKQEEENKIDLNNKSSSINAQKESSIPNQTVVSAVATSAERNQISQNQENNQISMNNINQNNDFTSQTEPQDLVTEPDRQNSPKQSEAQNSISNQLQIHQKTNISIPNLNNDSNIYGSESTNDPNSVKKRHLTSSQLSQKHFAKYSKSSQENMKGNQNSLDSNNNSQETVKLQSNSKTLTDFCNYNQRNPNKEEDEEEEEPELIEYQKPIASFPQTISNNTQNPSEFVIQNSNQKKSQQIQIQYEINDLITQFENVKQLKSQQDQTQRDSCDKFQSHRDQPQLEAKAKQQNEQIDQNRLFKTRKASFNQAKFVSHKKSNSNLRFSSTIATNTNNNNLTNSPNFLEQSSFFNDDTLKSATAQNIFNNKDKVRRQFFNYDDCQESYKNKGKIETIQLNKNTSGQEEANYISNTRNTEKENTRQYENNQNINYQKQNSHLMINLVKEPTLNNQLTHPTSHSPINHTYYAESNSKVVKTKNDQKQDNQLLSDQIKINIVNNENKTINNITKKSSTNEVQLKNRLIKNGDNSPSINQNLTDYLSFWQIFKKKADAERSFTCKQLCQMIWPQTLDRKQRRDKELVLQLYETEFNNENSQHQNIFEALSSYYNRFTTGVFQNQIDQYLQDLYQNRQSEITLFSLIHILAFLNKYKDLLDQTNRKVLKKIPLIYLLIKISKIILQKFKQNTFDKSIQILNKSVLDFLNELFYFIFLDSIQVIIGQEKLESHQISVKLYNKVDQNQSINTTEEILKFFEKNTTINS